MESGITTSPVSPPRSAVLAEVAYTHREEDFVAFWIYDWEKTRNQRFHPVERQFGSWTRLIVRRALTIAGILAVAFAISGERVTNYILGATSFTFCGIVAVGLTAWLVLGPKGPFQKLARSRYRRKMRGIAGLMAARKTEINLGRFHRLLLTADSCIRRTELDEVEAGSKISERIEIVTPWAAFERIEATEHHAFLMERRNSTTILPRRAFPDEAAFQQFVDLARRLHDDAIRGNAPPTNPEQEDERIRL